jgi:septal ring factor EnvC (AmiA/AmiB activator)
MIRSRIRMPILRTLVLTAGVVAIAGAAHAASADARLNQNAEQLARVRARIAELNQSIEKDRAQRDSLQSALEEAEAAVATAHAELRRATAEVDRQTSRVRDAKAQRDDAQRRLDGQKAALAGQVRAAYMIGSGGAAELAFSQDDPGRIARMVGYYDYLDRARASRIAAINTEVQRLAQLQQQYDEHIKSLQQLQDQRRQAFADLQARRSERVAAVAALQQRIAGETDELHQLQANEKQIEALLASLRRALADTPLPAGDSRPFPQMRGRLPWPMRGPLLANYGDPKAGGRLQWRGLWIGADEGTPVRACARGRVAYVGWMSRYGLIVVLEHEDGYFSLYGHASVVDKSAGDSVDAGDVIAAAGSTGGYEQPGLYFEIRKGTEPIDPRAWLRR